MKKRILSLILLLFALKTIASGSREKEIDSILNQTKELHVVAKMAPQLESAIKALDLAINMAMMKEKQKLIFGQQMHFRILDQFVPRVYSSIKNT